MPESTDRQLCRCHGKPMWKSRNSWVCSVRQGAAIQRWKEEHVDHINEIRRLNYQKNAERERERQRKWRAENPEQVRATSLRWQNEQVAESTPGPTTAYRTVHFHCNRSLPRVCYLEDETCKGRLSVALRRDTPADRIVGSPPTHFSREVGDYVRLCWSHHIRYDRGKVAL